MNDKTVKEFHEILLWPLRIHQEPSISPDDIHIHTILENYFWKEEKDLVLRGRKNKHLAYSEFVYFHPFAQRFLYNNDGKIRLYRRSNQVPQIKNASVVLQGHNEKTIHVAFEDIKLYHFCEMDIFVLVVEITVKTELTIKEAEDFLDQFRRVYPPYWKKDTGGHCPLQVTLYDNIYRHTVDGCQELYNKLASANYAKHDFFVDSCHANCQPPVAEHWQEIMRPLSLEEQSKAGSGKIPCLHIVDDRIPHMAHISFEHPGCLSRGDIIRLGLADDSGSSETLPYATEFLADFEKQYCYDRFWEGSGDPEEWKNTRYIVTDYSFTAIGKKDSDFSNPDYGMLAHFRHHYFQMMLVGQFYQATLLSLSTRLASTIKELREENISKREKFQDQARSMQHTLLIFTHSYWFTEISNQMQGKELFTMILQKQKTVQLYEKVKNASNELYEYLETDHQGKEAVLTSRLTVLATVGLLASIWTGIFGMEKTPLFIQNFLAETISIPIVTFSLLVITVVILLFSKPLGRFFEWVSSAKNLWKKS